MIKLVYTFDEKVEGNVSVIRTVEEDNPTDGEKVSCLKVSEIFTDSLKASKEVKKKNKKKE